ncbi:MAG: hypothetical protein LBU36_07515 [Clostridiales bacterium]|jgi:hypothetical protein|nr:hypothetical protein [Clostridiales bacterium]
MSNPTDDRDFSSPSNFAAYFARLVGAYESAHAEAYEKMNARGRMDFLKYTNLTFSRWYSSALFKGSALSPAYIMRLINERCGNGRFYVIPGVTTAASSSSEEYRLRFSASAYSLDHHPIAADLRFLIDYIKPSHDFSGPRFFTVAQESVIMQNISIKDSFYLEYLMIIAYNLRLVKNLKGVRVSTAVPTKELPAFLELPDREILSLIAKESVKISLGHIRGMIPGYSIPLDESFIYDLITRPQSTEEILSRIYIELFHSFENMIESGIEFEISQAMGPKKSLHSSEISEEDLYNLFASSRMVLNSVLVKYFFAIFGGFLKFIDPFFDKPWNFKDFRKALTENPQDVVVMFFSPCDRYEVSPLGLEFFGGKAAKGQAATSLPLSALFEIAGGKKPPNPARAAAAGPPAGSAFRLKVYPVASPSLWKIMEIEGGFTLDRLHQTIWREFFRDCPYLNYSFNTDASLSAFTAYTPPGRGPRFKKTVSVSLAELGLEEKSSFYYILESPASPLITQNEAAGPSVYRIDVIKIYPHAGIELFPQVTHTSGALRKMESMFDFMERFD